MKSRDKPTARETGNRVAQQARKSEIPRIGGTERCTVSVVKVVELIGVSTISWEDAAKQAVEHASKTIKNTTGSRSSAQPSRQQMERSSNTGQR
ncbi:MAG: dodecin family protein [Bacillota bacterium]